MMKRMYLLLTMIVLVLTFMSGCATSPNSGAVVPEVSEFTGTWVRQGGGNSDVLVISTTTFIETMSGDQNGLITLSISTYNESLNHFYGTVISATGDAEGMSGNYYFTYSITGNQLYFSADSNDYPTIAEIGPFIRQ